MHTWFQRVLIFVCLSTISSGQEEKPSAPIRNPFNRDRAAIAEGRELFGSGCTVCHGTTGQGGRGSRLARSQRVRGFNDQKLFDVIKNGVPGTQMPPSEYSEEQVWKLAAFVKSLNTGAIDQEVPGDELAGRAVFFGEGRCSQCHMIRGQGGLLGPDLSNIGEILLLDELEDSLLNPGEKIAPGYTAVSVVTRAGKQLSGVLKDESNYSVVIQDHEGSFHSFAKADLKEILRKTQSLMPKTELAADQLQNLLAFLSRQSLGPPPKPDASVEHGQEKEP